MSTIIETSNLTKNYGKSRGIIDINLEVNEGEIFGFIGPNGAGKSTTIRTLLGLIHPSSGSAKIFGKDVLVEGPEIREEIGYLPSEVFYYDRMRVHELLKYSASFYDKPKKQMEARIKELAGLLDLDLRRKIEDLSYGNRKKVGIIQGLLHSPKLIILDEPTGGLDPLMQQKFFDLLREENKKGATVLFSSHILGEVQRLCDRVAIIKEGRIIKVENMESLRGSTYIRCRIEAESVLEPRVFEIEGVSNLQIDENKASFLYSGDINKITDFLTLLRLKSVWIEEPELEEIFMHYYR
ncbi:MAG: ABC transporter ATP-binding protein [Actinobacteria bacterium]|nr:ABC transporter ATP-binding protein [Actinomycetota bacterium]